MSEIVCKSEKRVALLFSGFVRDFSVYKDLSCTLESIRKEGFKVDCFYSLFDRLGNFWIPGEFPKGNHSYWHGGLNDEIRKTKALDVLRFKLLFSPTSFELIDRESDFFYLEKTGIKHPQWFMVYRSFQVMENWEKDNDFEFDIVVRARLDNLPKDINGIKKACVELEDLEERTLLIMDRACYGKFELSDRLAVGNRKVMKEYCKIGEGHNFVSVEDTEFWKNSVKQPYIDTGGSHETHLAVWLKLKGISYIRKRYLDF